MTLATEDLIEAEEWIIQIQKAIYSIHCQVNVVKGSSINNDTVKRGVEDFVTTVLRPQQ